MYVLYYFNLTSVRPIFNSYLLKWRWIVVDIPWPQSGEVNIHNFQLFWYTQSRKQKLYFRQYIKKVFGWLFVDYRAILSLWLPGGEYYLLITSISARKKYLSPVWYILIPYMFYYIRDSNKRLESIFTNKQDKKGIPYRLSLPPTKMPCYLCLYQIR